jgi:hypothetical protein
VAVITTSETGVASVATAAVAEKAHDAASADANTPAQIHCRIPIENSRPPARVAK